ncbi:uncharacterized protein LOC131182074 [Hevea brasiliensis]|uniref:uncharacterized protein LOC131182074 n=1 Tax=Hevea brasiliensis TaxID=3981 RepID=UPI0025D77FB3|nr:uncharacterized protein LOC131182074 [Hevea brasiliensis]
MGEPRENTEEEAEKAEKEEPMEPKEQEELLLQIMKQSEYDMALELQETTSRNEEATAMVAKVMLKNGYEMGKGLGATLQGIVEPIPAIQKVGRCGLGYEEDALVDG